jgi:hypothetical protein
MALNEGERLIKPEQIQKQVSWEKLEGVVILGLRKKGEANSLQMSSVTIDELAMLTSQLNAHLAYLLGPMKEG